MYIPPEKNSWTLYFEYISTIGGTGPVSWRPVPVPVWISQTGPDRPVYRSDRSNGKWPVERRTAGRTANDRSNGERPVERQMTGRTANDRSNGKWPIEQQSTILCMIDKCWEKYILIIDTFDLLWDNF